MIRAMVLQGSGISLPSVSGGADARQGTTKGLTGSMYLSKFCAGRRLVRWPVLGKALIAVTRDWCGSTGLLWRRNDGGPVECIYTPRLPPAGFWVVGCMNWRGTMHECSAAPAFDSQQGIHGPQIARHADFVAWMSLSPTAFLSGNNGFRGACAAQSSSHLCLLVSRGSWLMRYRAVTTSVEGFVQQIACCYLRHGYWFYIRGHVPPRKEPELIDRKLIDKYGIDVSESTRARRKKAGRSNLQYIRHESTFVILATKGEHRFFSEESNLIRDIRRVPLRYAGYAISYKPGGRKKDGSGDDKWHAHVAIDRQRFLELRAWFAERALRESTEKLALAFYELPIAPYAPVRRQLLMLLREVNRLRKTAGKRPIPAEVLPLRRRVVRPFEAQDRAQPHPSLNG